jgi:hypothetical protein
MKNSKERLAFFVVSIGRDGCLPFVLLVFFLSMLLKEVPLIYKQAGGAGVQKGEANSTTAEQAWSSVFILYATGPSCRRSEYISADIRSL